MLRFFKTLFSRGRIVKDLLGFLWKKKLWWLLPLVLVIVLFGFLVLVASQPAVQPFIYTLF